MNSVKTWFVYLLKCADGSYYTGITTDVERRVKQHNEGKGSKYVKNRLPAVFVCRSTDSYSRSEAQRIEYKIKQIPHTQKAMLVNADRVSDLTMPIFVADCMSFNKKKDNNYLTQKI